MKLDVCVSSSSSSSSGDVAVEQITFRTKENAVDLHSAAGVPKLWRRWFGESS